MQSWQKWSFPVCPLRRCSGDLADWRPVAKKRRISRFSLAGGRVMAGAPVLAGQLACAVELTQTIPAGVELCPHNSRSYAEWLGQRLGAGRDAAARSITQQGGC
jgi:hypothetical protein